MTSESDTDLLFSEARFEDDTRFNVSLIDDDLPEDDYKKSVTLTSAFTTKGTNLGGEEQARHLIDEAISNDALVVQCDLDQIIHGTMVDGGVPATLAVLQFAFVPRGTKRRFKEAEITITFSSGEVHAITP